jgi:hypothetical protein
MPGTYKKRMEGTNFNSFNLFQIEIINLMIWQVPGCIIINHFSVYVKYSPYEKLL